MQDPKEHNAKAIFTFLLLTLGISSIFYFAIIYTGQIGSGWGRYVNGLMWSPGIAAILTCKILKINISSLGWKWGKSSYQFWSYTVPILYSILAYAIIWGFGLGTFFEPGYLKEIIESFGFRGLPGWLSVILFTLVNGTVGMARSAASALGEEIGWRGFLVPRLYKKFGYTKTSLLSGGIWALWHFPILLFADYNNGAWFGLTCFTVMVVSMSFTMTWFRMRSGSLWTAVLIHASHNLFIQQIFTPLTIDTGNTKYYMDEFGAVLPVISLFVAFYFWMKRKELPVEVV